MREIDARRLTREKKDKVLDYYGHVCVYCQNEADEVDHIIPWSYIHDDSFENLVAACWICNRIAWSFVFDTFDEKREYIINKRGLFFKKNIIPVWTRCEIFELGYALRSSIENSVVIAEDDKDRENIVRKLTEFGFSVLTGNARERVNRKKK